MDIKKLYCRYDSPYFSEYVALIKRELPEYIDDIECLAGRALTETDACMSTHDEQGEYLSIGYSDEQWHIGCGFIAFAGSRGGQMIDLTNAPEGATHYIDGNVLVFYKKTFCGTWMAHCGKWEVSGNPSAYNDAKCKAIPCKEWSIYNNTKPLSELSDEQAAELFNYWRNGGKVEHKGTYSGEWSGNLSPHWNATSTYRAKQKSELELFIDAAMKFCIGGKRAEDTFSDMFNAGFKAPKAGE